MMAGDAIIVVERAQKLESSWRAFTHCHRDGAVEGDHRVRRDSLEEPVESKDLGPIGVLCPGRLVMDRGDCCLELVGAKRHSGQAIGHERALGLSAKLVLR